MKRAFLVLGPPASGTRLATQLLMAAGCYGDYSHQQRIDKALPENEPLIVWRRSIPHGDDWPDIAALLARLDGYEVTAVVTMRDWRFMIRSQMGQPYAAQYAPDQETAVANVRRSYREIFDALRNVPYVVVVYESLVRDSVAAVSGLHDLLGLEAETAVYIYDGNEKYREGTAV